LERTERRTWLAVAACAFAIAALVRAAGLEHQSLWLDEFLAFFIGQADVATLLERTRAIQGQSPFYYLVVHGWTALFGRDDVTTMRALSVVLGLASLVQVWFLVRRAAGEARAAVTLALLALSPFHLYFSQEARMYPLLVVLMLAAAQLVLAAVQDPAARRPARFVALALVSAAALYTHYYAFLFLGALGLFVLWRGRPARDVVAPIVAAEIVAVLLYLPWLPALFHAAAGGGNTFIRFVPLKGLYTGFTFALGYSSVVIDANAQEDLLGTFRAHALQIGLAGLAFGVLAAAGVRALWRDAPELCRLALLVIVLPIAIATLVSLRFPIISERYFTPAQPFFLLFVASGALALRGAARWLPLALALALTGHSLWNYWANPAYGNHDWRAAVAYVEERAKPDDAVVFHPRVVQYCYEFYAGKRGALRDAVPADSPEAVAMLPTDRRYWLVISHPGREEAQVIEALDARFARAETVLLPRGEGIRILLFAPRDGERTGGGDS
jgi:uncharacterized membrane protein